MKEELIICKTCVMDTTDPEITFDSEGVCSHCRDYERYEKESMLVDDKAKEKLDELVKMMKAHGKGKEYDCIMGLSGGVDSSYLAYFATKELGLRPLVVHIDSGWNSELAVNNIENIVKILDLDLHTLVLDWDEIRDLQLSFFRASLANLDVPQDHSFIAGLYNEAKKYNIKYVLNGGNMATESILPNSWGYDAADSWHLLDVHKKYGEVKLKNFPIIGYFKKRFYVPFILKAQAIRPLEYIPYVKSDIKEFLKEKLNWRDYGGKHYESRFTKFFQAHYLPEKFGFDKRKAHLSSLIVSGQMTREEALEEMKIPLYDPQELEEDREFFIKKLGITREEYDKVMAQPPKTFMDFKNQIKVDKFIRSIAKKIVSLKPRKTTKA